MCAGRKTVFMYIWMYAILMLVHEMIVIVLYVCMYAICMCVHAMIVIVRPDYIHVCMENAYVSLK